ncbi:unnamed protein product [Moneuplotes crassus]|uniref:Uncharacterized protein n=1 Tax=Euplotes crassus TaxID=5936 RepID=A0AAD1UQS8_EUPCR|nr:unnamed protein product [Moneuplotes crassus]
MLLEGTNLYCNPPVSDHMQAECSNGAAPKPERKVAHSVEYRRKDNGNIISSIYPPESSLMFPQHVNHEIEKELREFMTENEEKFKNSKMNQTFKFPRKQPKIDLPIHHKSSYIRMNTPGSASYRSNRRYKSQENTGKYVLKDNKAAFVPLNGNFMPGDSGSTDSVRKNYKMLQKTLNLSFPERQNKFKININQSILKKNLKKLNRKPSTRKKRMLTETINSNNSIRKIKSTDRDAKRADNRYILNKNFNSKIDTIDFSTKSFINYSSSKGAHFCESNTPKEHTKRKKSKRKPNKTPVGRYGRKHREVNANNFHMNSVNQPSIEGHIMNSKTEFSSPKLFCIPSNHSIMNQSYRAKQR